MLAHQAFEAFEVFLLHVVHQLVVLGVGSVAAVFLGDGHGGEAADVFVLPFDDPESALHAGNRGQPRVEVPGAGRQLRDHVFSS